MWELDTDVCVVGSGGAGAVIAARFSEAGLDVVLLEKGPYITSSDMNSDEAGMAALLFKDGGQQINKTFDMTFLQGCCVGGSTLLTNGICFRVPERILDHWETLGCRFDRKRLAAAYDEVEKNINARVPNPSVSPRVFMDRFMKGCDKIGYRGEVFRKNFKDCVACGYCNIGCIYGKKQSHIETYIPRALENGTRLVAECEGKRVLFKNRRATGVEAIKKDGKKIIVNSRLVVVSCGAIASSGLLLRSRVRNRNVGRYLSGNLGTVITGEFDEPLYTYAGDQMPAYVDFRDEGYALETLFNPPGTQSIMMPGPVADHTELMRNYEKLATIGVLFGAKSYGRVTYSRLFKHEEIDYRPSEEDMEMLRAGLKRAARLLLASGAKRAISPTSRYLELKSSMDIDKLDEAISGPKDLNHFGTAHPFGGNVMSENPARGVVDNDFRVHGYEDLFVCDASVFPSPVQLNPMATVLATAEYASDMILKYSRGLRQQINL